MRLRLFLILSLAFSASANAASITAASPAQSDVATAITSAANGDTVIIPSGTASWTSTLTITKGITLQGATTVNGTGTQNATANDATIVINNSGAGLIKVQLSSAQAFRLTGFTFSKGTSQGTVVTLSGNGPGPHMNARIDHCHFNDFPGEAIDVSGWTYGVADHNYMHTSTGGTCFMIGTPNYNGGVLGHGAFADYPFFGTDKFFFIEDNSMRGNGSSPTAGNIDAMFGARLVVRHNDFTNCRLGWHGTEGAYRGTRALECYANATHWSILMSAMNRSGVALYHDNTWDGMKSQSGNAHGQIVIFREYAGVGSDCPYAYADGTGPFDGNDTEGNGTYVRGHAPFIFDSGTCSSAITQQGSVGVMTDNTKNWSANQWVGYSIKMKTGQAAPKGSYITSNTANTITYVYYDGTDRGPQLIFQSGNTYEIHKLLVALDQVGRGKGDLLSGIGPITNTVTGGQGWTEQALEPAMSWNNVFTGDGTAYGFGCSMPSEKQGRDYYNLGKGLATDGAPSQVTSIYTASLNGVDYVGPYKYPHPLQTGATPTPTPTPSPSPTPTPTPTATPSPSPTPTPTPTATPTPTPAPSLTPTPSPSPTPDPSSTPTPSPSPSATPINIAPTVNAGADQTIANSIMLSGIATDDGLPSPPATCTYLWRKVSGPGPVSFDSPTALATRVSFAKRGTFVISLTVSDGALSATDQITVRY